MQRTLLAGWVSSFSILFSMVIGHTGQYKLSWVSNQISTFAAKGENDAWITASLILSIISLV